MWNTLDFIWQEAFSEAWEAFKRNSIPIGALVVNAQGDIVATGRNAIFENATDNPLAGTQMGHAEVSAMMTLKDDDHTDINNYTLISTMEPCPMCFGTMVIMGIRNLKYAAKDGWAGATEMNDQLEYIKIKHLKIERMAGDLEVFQICMQSVFEFSRRQTKKCRVTESWKDYCHEAVVLAETLFDEGYFLKAKDEGHLIGDIYNEVLRRYDRQLGGEHGSN